MPSELPDLPIKHRQDEAAFGLAFREWMRKNWKQMDSGSFELKHTRGANSLPFDAVGTEQLAYASKVAGNGALIRVQGLAGEPDYVWLKDAPAWIVVRYPRFWCMIRSYDYVWERNMGKRKSLTSERARAISKIVVEV